MVCARRRNDDAFSLQTHYDNTDKRRRSMSTVGVYPIRPQSFGADGPIPPKRKKYAMMGAPNTGGQIRLN